MQGRYLYRISKGVVLRKQLFVVVVLINLKLIWAQVKGAKQHQQAHHEQICKFKIHLVFVLQMSDN